MKTKKTTHIIGFSLSIIIALTLFTGCKSTFEGSTSEIYQSYSGPVSQRDAVLKIEGHPYLYVTSVDGVKIWSGSKYVRLLPGEHTISFANSYSTGGYNYHSADDANKYIYVEAGMTYVATACFYFKQTTHHSLPWDVSINEDATAQNKLGMMYMLGKGVAQDYAQALDWFQKSADQGNAAAQCNLGWMYQNGKGVAQDYAQALDWFQKSAAQGNAAAENKLGAMYMNGRGVTQDYAQARDWFRRSAAQGNAAAQDNLGAMYLNGKGMAQDYAQALDWFQKSAAQSNSMGKVNLGWMYENGYGVRTDRDQAIQWYHKAANQGNENAMKNLQRLGTQ